MNRKVSELSVEELKKVLEVNSKLQDKVYEDYQDAEMFWVTDYLDCFRDCLSDYSIGFGNRNYLKVNASKRNDFFIGALKAQNDYGFLPDNWTPIINEMIEKVNMLYDLEYNSKEYDDLDEWLDDQLNTLSQAVLNQFNKQTDYPSKDSMIDYFVGTYASNRLDSDDFYVDENYILYKHIDEIESYA